jgi:hypothetical protein
LSTNVKLRGSVIVRFSPALIRGAARPSIPNMKTAIRCRQWARYLGRAVVVESEKLFQRRNKAAVAEQTHAEIARATEAPQSSGPSQLKQLPSFARTIAGDVRVFDLHPVRRTSRPIPTRRVLRHNSFQAHPASARISAGQSRQPRAHSTGCHRRSASAACRASASGFAGSRPACRWLRLGRHLS